MTRLSFVGKLTLREGKVSRDGTAGADWVVGFEVDAWAAAGCDEEGEVLVTRFARPAGRVAGREVVVVMGLMVPAGWVAGPAAFAR